jgi:trehalose utilization protein
MLRCHDTHTNIIIKVWFRNSEAVRGGYTYRHRQGNIISLLSSFKSKKSRNRTSYVA